MTTWATADQHYGHQSKKGGIIKYCNRPFATIEEHDQQLIKNHNEVIDDSDTVWMAGDFTLASHTFAIHIFRQLNGRQINIIPSMDHDVRWLKGFDKFPDDLKERIVIRGLMHEVKYQDTYFLISHYPQLTWSRSKYGSINLHGHSHGMVGHWGNSAEKDDVPTYGIRLDIGVDVWDYHPISLPKLVRKSAEVRRMIDAKRREMFGRSNTPIL